MSLVAPVSYILGYTSMPLI